MDKLWTRCIFLLVCTLVTSTMYFVRLLVAVTVCIVRDLQCSHMHLAAQLSLCIVHGIGRKRVLDQKSRAAADAQPTLHVLLSLYKGASDNA